MWMVAAPLVLAAGLLLAAGVVIAWLTTSLPTWNGTATAVGLRHPTELRRDAHGVTHIRADSETDAYFALGYAHAQDRLWQIDLYRRIGAGRVAEVVGRPGLPIDRLMRTFGV